MTSRTLSPRAAITPDGANGGEQVPYVCPRCRSELAKERERLTCAACPATYPRLTAAYADFAGPGVTFDDWWSRDAETMRAWMQGAGAREERFQILSAQRYLLPLLAQLGLQPGRATVLSTACGLAADVDVLNDAGYATWGIDCGQRVQGWTSRRWPERLARADLFHLPFPAGSFDLVTALNVLEHVGVIGDTTDVQLDYAEQRLAAVESLLRVTRPGGYVLLCGVNRRFPADFFHLQNGGFVRLHSPREAFSLSYGDQERLSLATGLADWARPLPLRGFFSYLNMSRHPVSRPLLPLLDWLLGVLPAAVYGSWLSFFSIVLVHRRADPFTAPVGRKE